MASIKQPILDVMNRIRNELPAFKTIRIWNNQPKAEKDGQYVAYPKPACFVQVMTGAEWAALQGGNTASDLVMLFHIIHEYYDAADGTFEQDLPVFDLRDSVLAKFTLFKPSGCGPFSLVMDTQDEDHDNIYEYIVGFATHFIDTAGATQYITKQTPTNLQATVQFTDPKNYIIPK